MGVLSALYCPLDNRYGEGCCRMCLGVALQISLRSICPRCVFARYALTDSIKILINLT